jgi:hypothetical protein
MPSIMRPATPREIRLDASYRNTNNWKSPEDLFNRFFRFEDGKGINNTSGFRPKSKAGGDTDITESAFCVLVTNFGESEWPDALDRESGVFAYYGDNRSAGRALLDTAVGGNRLLEKAFTKVHLGDRSNIQPFLCFEKYKADTGTQMRFLGLACPGGERLTGLEDLVAVWRVKGDLRFQNYRALFTILKVDCVSHAWLQDMVNGTSPADSPHCPGPWKTWVRSGAYSPLRCIRRQMPRTRAEQMPQTADERSVLRRVFDELTPREFEFFAAALLPMIDGQFVDLVVTKAVRDGGRDVLGKYRVGHDLHQVLLETYVEAKRWELNSAVGVKPMMRLLARLKHRDLGVFVTTSFFETQVQKELIEDGHPVLLVSGGDIARILIGAELGGRDGGRTLDSLLARIRAEATGHSS